MTFSVNSVEYIGTLVNVKTRFSGQGKEFADFDVVVSETDKDGKERSHLIRGFTAGRTVAALKAIKIGSTVLVRGSLHGEERTHQQSGRNYYKLELFAFAVFPLALSGPADGGPGQVQAALNKNVSEVPF